MDLRRDVEKEGLIIRVKRKLNSTDVLDALADLFILRGPPEYIRSDRPKSITPKVVPEDCNWPGVAELTVR